MKRILSGACIAFGVLVALVGLRLVVGRLAAPSILEEARAHFESEVGPLRPKLADTTVPPEENAAPLLREAGSALEIEQADHELLTSIREDPGISDPRLRELVHRLVDRNAAVLARIDRAAERPDSHFRPRREHFRGEHDPIEWVAILQLSRLVRAAGRVAVVEDDRAAYLASIKRLATLTRALRQERTIVGWIVAGASEEMLHELVRLRLTRPVPAELVATLDGVLTKVESAPRLREVLTVEGTIADATYAEAEDAARESGQETRFSEMLSPWSEPHFRAATLLTYVEVSRRLDQPRTDWPEPELESWMHRLRSLADPFSTPDVIRAILLPNLLDVVEKTQRAQAERALVRAALAYLSGAPPEAETVVYSNERIRRRTLEDGTLELSLPRAAELIRAEAASFPDPINPARRKLERQADRLTWRLPSPYDNAD